MIEWVAEDRFQVGGLRFRCTHDYSSRTSEEEIIILKRRPFIEFYADLFTRKRPAHLVELGIFEGGSSLLWAALFPEMRVTAIDNRKQNDAVLSLAQRLPNLALHYETSQTDEALLARTAKPSMVIDDASHQYALSRRSFEILFPRLSPGEQYVIEDWGWGHWPGWNTAQWADAPTLSNLVAELTVAAASAQQWVAKIECDSRSCVVTRGGASGASLSLDELWERRGRSLSLSA